MNEKENKNVAVEGNSDRNKTVRVAFVCAMLVGIFWLLTNAVIHNNGYNVKFSMDNNTQEVLEGLSVCSHETSCLEGCLKASGDYISKACYDTCKNQTGIGQYGQI